MSDVQMTPIQEFRKQIEGRQRDEIAKLLPPGVEVDRFVRTALSAVQRNQDLLFADRASLWDACLRAAQDGLLPDGRESVLNIYSTKAKVWNEQRGCEVDGWVPKVQYLPMVRGIIKVLYATGAVAHIDAAAVYEADFFEFHRGDNARIDHRPYDGPDEPGAVKAAYVIVKLNNGEIHREVMFRRDIEKVRQSSKTGDKGPWKAWYDQMAIKSVIKRAAKILPTDSETVLRVIAHDNEAMGYHDGFEDDDQMRDDTPQPQDQPTQAPALTDERATQAANTVRRPSRMAAIMQRQQQQPAQDVHPHDLPWNGDDCGYN